MTGNPIYISLKQHHSWCVSFRSKYIKSWRANTNVASEILRYFSRYLDAVRRGRENYRYPLPILPAYITRLFFPRCNPLSSPSLLSGRESQKRLFRPRRRSRRRSLSLGTQWDKDTPFVSTNYNTYRWLVPAEDEFFFCPCREAHSAHSTHLLYSHQWKITLWKFVCLALSFHFHFFFFLLILPQVSQVSRTRPSHALRDFIFSHLRLSQPGEFAN